VGSRRACGMGDGRCAGSRIGSSAWDAAPYDRLVLPQPAPPGCAFFRTLTAVVVGALLVGALAGCTDTAWVPPSTAAATTSAGTTYPPTVTTTIPITTTTTSTTAPPVVTTPPTEAAPAGLRPLIPGHNRLDARRINLIFAPYGWDDLGAFEEIARWFLGWDGHALLSDADGWPVTDASRAEHADLGLFGIEPFRSHRGSFNLWIADTGPSEDSEWIYGPDPFADVPYRVVITLAFDPPEGSNGSYSHSGQDQKVWWPNNVAADDTDPFTNVVVAVWSWYPASSIAVVPHELGHALFGLADEYGWYWDPDPYPRGDIGPSCAASRATAEAWWGDLIGQYDPMIDVWIDEMTAAGFERQVVGGSSSWRDKVRVAYVAGGCFGLEGSFRSAEDTMMGFNLPAFGLTNRRWMEEVLAEFPTVP
jgi:hypothetical protein